MEFSERQKGIIEIVKNHEPITSEQIASLLSVVRSTLRTDLSVLTKMHILEARPKVGYCYLGDQLPSKTSSEYAKVTVDEVMSRSVAVDEKMSIYDAIVTMFLEDAGTIFVLSHGYLAGVISRKDFIKSAIGGADMKQIPVGIIMTRMPNIVIATVNEPMIDVARKIMEHEVDCLPVVETEDDNGDTKYKVVGRISKTNLTELYVEMFKDM